MCPNAASVIELKTSWESVLFAFRSPFTVLCCCMAWGKGTVLYCLYMYCFARIDTGNSRSEKFVIVAGNKLFTFAFSQRIGTTTSVFYPPPRRPSSTPLPPYHVLHRRSTSNTMSDNKIPAGLSIWQIKALQEIDRLEEEKDEMLKHMAFERQQIEQLKPVKDQIRGELWRARQQMGHHNTLVADPKHDSLRELKSRKMGAEGVSDANRIRLERQCELVIKRTMHEMAKVNKSKGINEQMKKDIDLQRRERIIFDRVFKRMQDELADCKDESRRLEEQIEASYTERDAAQFQMQELKSQYEQEKHAFIKEYEDISIIIESEKRAFERITNSTKKKSTPLAMRSPEHTRAGLLMQRRRNNKNHQQEQKEADVLRREQSRIVDEVERIVEGLGLEFEARATFQDKINVLIKVYRGMESEKFEKVEKVTRLTHSLENVTDSVRELDDDFNGVLESKQSLNNTRATELAHYQHELLRVQKELKVADEQRRRASEALTMIFEPVHTVFFKIGCDKIVTRNDDAMDYMTTDEGEKNSIADPTTEVNNDNVMLYLGVLVQRAHEALQQYAQYLRNAVDSNKRRRAEQTAAAAAAAAMGSPLKVKREREFKPKFPTIGPKSNVHAVSMYESIGQRIPSLKDDDGDLTEDEVNKLLLENSRALSAEDENSTNSLFTSSFRSRIPSKSVRRKRKK